MPIATTQTSLIKVWSQSHICANNFWDIWRKEYLYSFRDINRWEHKHPRSVANTTPRADDIVLLRDDSTPRVHWKLLPVSYDVRSAKILLPNGKMLNRSINFLYPLEINSSGSGSCAPPDTPDIQPPSSSSSTNESSIMSPIPRRSKRIASLPPKSYIYFIYLISIVSNTLANETRCDNTSTVQLIHLHECTHSGVAIYFTNEGFYCFDYHTCDSGTFLHKFAILICADPLANALDGLPLVAHIPEIKYPIA
uniref:DUF5641 domain-containing protein n=1 Tax=Heterorhabditis bacteriophora TaxID=37862 RepID=A0A1I7XI82_HETBA